MILQQMMAAATSSAVAADADDGGVASPCSPLLVFGMDANTYKVHDEGKRQGVIDFTKHLATMNILTCWGAGKI